MYIIYKLHIRISRGIPYYQYCELENEGFQKQFQ
jgi:hypothetical protein